MMSPFERCKEAGQSGGGEARESGDVQLDHVVHVVDVRIDQLGGAAEAGIVDQRGDAAVGTQALLDALEVGLHGQVGGQDFGLAAGLCGDIVRQLVRRC